MALTKAARLRRSGHAGATFGAPAAFLESNRPLRRISLPKENYENSNLNLPLLDRARSACVRSIADGRAFALGLLNCSRFCQRRREYFTRGDCDAR